MPSRPNCGKRCIQSLRVEISRQLRYRQFRRIIGKWPELEVEVEVELQMLGARNLLLADTLGARNRRNRKVVARFLKEIGARIDSVLDLPQTSVLALN